MKHGIYYAYWEKEWAADYTYYVDKVARLGFDILEVGAAPLPDYTTDQIRALRDCAKANNIELTAGYGPTYDHNLGSADPAIRKNAKEWFTRLFDVMAQLDIHLIGGALYSYWPLDFSQGVDKEGDWKRSVEAMQDIAPVAKQYDITLGMEVLNRFENHILNTAEEGVAFVKEVGMDNVKVMLDTFHMNIEGIKHNFHVVHAYFFYESDAFFCGVQDMVLEAVQDFHSQGDVILFCYRGDILHGFHTAFPVAFLIYALGEVQRPVGIECAADQMDVKLC